MISEGVEMELSAELYTQEYLGEPVAPAEIKPGEHLRRIYRARISAAHAHYRFIPSEIERNALSWTIQHGFKDRFDIEVSELFLKDLHEEISDFLNKVGHHNLFDLKLISDGQTPRVFRARLVLSKRRIRAEIKLQYGPASEWIILRIPILQKGEEVPDG